MTAGRASLLAAFVAFGCGSPDMRAVGPDVSFGVRLNVSQMGDGVNEDGNVIYTESIMVSSTAGISLAWAFQHGALWWRPSVYLGSGAGMIDGGRLVGLIDAEFDSWSGPALGAGIEGRIALRSSPYRLGFGMKYLSWSGESMFNTDAPPSSTRQDAGTSNMDVTVIFDYAGVRFRPFMEAGVLVYSTVFEDDSDNRTTVESREPIGLRFGVEMKGLMGTGMNASIDAGYFGGIDARLSVGYSF